jgi:hypothetical protein
MLGSNYSALLGRRGLRSASLGFDLHADRPDESQQVATNCRHGFLFAFAPRGQVTVTSMQPMLSVPRDLFHVRADRDLALAKRGADCGAISIRPRGLDDDSPEVRVAGLGDAASANSVAGRIFTRDGAAATTSHFTPSAVSCQYTTYPVGSAS